jgi:hypothetical protein
MDDDIEMSLGLELGTARDVRICHSDGKIVFTIHPDGTVVLGEGVSLDEAGLEFWRAIAMMAPLGHKLLVRPEDE